MPEQVDNPVYLGTFLTFAGDRDAPKARGLVANCVTIAMENTSVVEGHRYLNELSTVHE